MSDRERQKIMLLNKNIFGSITDDGKYEDDTVIEVMEWLAAWLQEVPPEYRETAKVEIESIGGYEGEHHAEISLYYERPETDAEMASRLAERRRYFEQEQQRHARYAAEAMARLAQLDGEIAESAKEGS